jgi:hypothetical protein
MNKASVLIDVPLTASNSTTPMRTKPTNHKNYILSTGYPFSAKLRIKDTQGKETFTAYPIVALNFCTDGRVEGLIVHSGTLTFAEDVAGFIGYQYDKA